MMQEMLTKLEYDGYPVYSDGKKFWYYKQTCGCGHKDKIYLPMKHTAPKEAPHE